MSWAPTPEELHTSWIAFKRLHEMSVVTIGITERQESAAIKAGWVKLRHMFSVGNAILSKMLDNSRDFHIAYDSFGVDIVSKAGGHPLRPWDLVNILRAEQEPRKAQM